VLKWPFMRDFVVTSPFGERVHPVTGEKGSHRGTDYATPVGTPVYSPLTGIVSLVGEDDRAGKFVGVKNKNFYVSFSHLSQIVAQKGEVVTTGQVLGLTGATGMVTGPHVHVVVRDSQGKRIDPETVLDATNGIESDDGGWVLALATIGALL